MRFRVLFSLALAAVVVAKSGEVASSNEVEEISQELSQGLVEADFEPTVRARKFGHHHHHHKDPNGLAQKYGELFAELEKAVGEKAVEDAFSKVLPIKQFEDASGISKLEQSLNIIKGCAPTGAIQYIGKAIKHLEHEFGVKHFENLVNKATGGNLYHLLDVLGLSKVEHEGLNL